MSVVVKSNILTVVTINAGSGDNRSAQISADVFDDLFVVGESGFSVDIKAVRAVFVNIRFGFFERGTELCFHMIQKSCAERIAEQRIVEMLDGTPNGIVADAALGKQDVNVRIPFEVPAECVENANKSGRKVFRLIHFEEHTADNIADGVKKTIQQFTVLPKKGRSSSGIVKTQCLCFVRMSLKDMAVDRRIEYRLPQVVQNRLLQRKGTTLKPPQHSQPYKA